MSDDRYRLMFDNVPLGYLSLDVDANIIDCNRAFATLLGYGEQELLGCTFASILHDRVEYHRAVSFPEFKRRGEARDIAFTLKHRNGELVHVVMHGKVRYDERGGFIQTHCMVIDVSDKVALERELVRLTTAERQRIGHDLHDGVGQELTGIAFVASALVQRLDRGDAELLSMAETLKASAARAKGLMADVLQGLSRVADVPEGLSVAMARLTDSVPALFGVACHYRELGRVRIEDNLIASNLYLIAHEAIHNALKHSGCAVIEVTLTASKGDLRLEVADDGLGLRSEWEGADGMGLKIMKHRASVLGASLQIHSGDNGVTVCCELPRQPGQEERE
ncbi:PAS domain-containing sensor histidine kinase [Ferrimonas futtsuensis]|uniref:PAS domain-containing sensor histidine kinase n=1 Tax=Ferrimonas futtsuensis TaxID=364764 RepID=UPI0003F8E656|nr:PAS domain S-box protein [Ferrimonas futtsuensis]